MRTLISLSLFTLLALPACVQDASVPSSQQANLDDRTAPDAVCGGESVACFMLDEETCTTADGCGLVGACTGYAARCGYWRAQGACEAQEGCEWTPDDGEDGGHCGGVVTPCHAFDDPTACAEQLNCHWEQFCGGLATECSERPADDCASQPGCRVED